MRSVTIADGSRNVVSGAVRAGFDLLAEQIELDSAKTATQRGAREIILPREETYDPSYLGLDRLADAIRAGH